MSLRSPEANVFWGIVLGFTLFLWLFCIVKFRLSADYQFPDTIYRVVFCDFSVLVFFFSTSKYTEDFPYVLALVTAIVEYVLLSTWFSQWVTFVTCGCNPLTIALDGLNYAIFIIGTSFNFSRSIWALLVADGGRGANTMYDLIPGRTSGLDTFWWLTAAFVAACIVTCGYSRNQRARQHQQYSEVSMD